MEIDKKRSEEEGEYDLETIAVAKKRTRGKGMPDLFLFNYYKSQPLDSFLPRVSHP